MIAYKIKTYAGGEVPTSQGLKFWILSKGLHAGRPSKQPYCNSLEVTADSEEASNILYWVAFSIWKLGRVKQILVGSVIPFVRVYEYKKLLADALFIVSSEKVNAQSEQMQKAQQVMTIAKAKVKLLEQLQQAIAKQLLSPKLT